jgi:hypothetical protein
MHVQPHIFHLKENRLKGAKLGSEQRQPRKQASDVVSFGLLEQKLELERDGLCV